MRHRHAEGFTVVGNHLAQHKELSAVAIGLAVYIQSLPDGVSVTAKALALRFREGEKTIRRALNELEAAGYIARPRLPVGGGKFATRTISYDKPGCGSVVPSGGTAAVKDAPTPDAEMDPDPGPDSDPDSDPDPGPDSDPDSDPDPDPPAPRRVRRSDAPRPPRGRGLPAPRRVPAPRDVPEPPRGPAVDLLARLRLADPRLLLSARDVRQLAPAVDVWLGRAATPDQITRTLTVNLPPERVPIHHPARFLEYRLATHLPPPLPVEAPPPAPPAPLTTCDGCERAFRSHDPDERCGDCRAAA